MQSYQFFYLDQGKGSTGQCSNYCLVLSDHTVFNANLTLGLSQSIHSVLRIIEIAHVLPYSIGPDQGASTSIKRFQEPSLPLQQTQSAPSCNKIATMRLTICCAYRSSRHFHCRDKFLFQNSQSSCQVSLHYPVPIPDHSSTQDNKSTKWILNRVSTTSHGGHF